MRDLAKRNLHVARAEAYKRGFDISILVLAHVLLLPLWLALWAIIPVLIWLGDRGTVFYRQQRVGKDGQTFTVIKFRTMVLDADTKGPGWTVDSDPRVTRVGRFLRRCALDELPEVLSIWKGDMSLVGPRALEVEEHRLFEEHIPEFATRLQVRPGLTGLAQVYDRADNPLDKFKYDLEYLRRMSPWLDISILALSVRNTLAARWDWRSGKPLTRTTTLSPTEEAIHRADGVYNDDARPANNRPE